jgi:hypothetical protein
VTAWDDTLYVHARAGRGLVPRRGIDLVLEPPDSHASTLAPGTLLHDHFEPDDRESLDAAALGRFAAWTERRRDALIVDGIDVAWIWGEEICAEVFLPEVATVLGLQRVLGSEPPRRVSLKGVDDELGRAIEAMVDFEVELDASAPEPLRYPRLRASPWKVPPLRRAYRAVITALGVPPFPRGNVLLLPYWHLIPVHERLLDEPGLLPLHNPLSLPALPPRELVRALLRGGWTGAPNALQARRSRRALGRALDAARRQPAPGDALDRLLDTRALRLLEDRAPSTVAQVRSARRALARPEVGGVLLGWDTPPHARSVIVAARQTDKPVILVQHGLANEPDSEDMLASDVVGVWSQRVVDELASRTDARIEVTGNPGHAPLPASARKRAEGCTVILPEYESRLSLRIVPGTPRRCVETALEAVQAARPGTVALVRPHPSDHDPEAFRELGARFPELRIEVDTKSPIQDVIARGDLCIAGPSTATLQSAIAGLPTIFLNMVDATRAWPFDDSGVFPTVTTAEELTAEIPRALAGEGQPPRAAIEDALGEVPDAIDRVLALLRSAFTGSGEAAGSAASGEPAGARPG